MKTNKNKRGRPKSKQSSQQFLGESFLERYGEYTQAHLKLALDGFSTSGLISEEFSKRFLEVDHYDLPENISGPDDTWKHITEYYKHEGEIFRLNISKSDPSAEAKWMFLAGIRYACWELIFKDVFSIILDPEVWDVHNASSMSRFYRKMDPNSKFTPQLPSDLKRKIFPPLVDAHAINALRLKIKEMKGRAWVDKVAEELGISSNEVEQIVKVANSQKRNRQIEIRSDNGRKFVLI